MRIAALILTFSLVACSSDSSTQSNSAALGDSGATGGTTSNTGGTSSHATGGAVGQGTGGAGAGAAHPHASAFRRGYFYFGQYVEGSESESGDRGATE